MSGLRDLQRALYLAQRATGDVNAARRGPEVLAKRLIRRRVTRGVFQALRKAGLR